MGYKNPNSFSKRGFAALITCGIILFSVGTLNLGMPIQNAQAAESETCDRELNIQKISSSKSSTSPYLAIDDNSLTSWNGQGKGSWIKPDLGGNQVVCYAEIDWFGGSSQQYNFAILVSTDGSTWKLVYTGKSSGVDVSAERYDFGDVEARWVKISLNGNQQDMRSSIQEVNVFGHGVGTLPEPEPIPEPTPTPSTDTKYDPNTFIDSVKNGLGQTIANGGTTSDSRLSIYYRGTDNVGVAYFQGALDGGAWSKITTSSPLLLDIKAEGQHKYMIRAIDDGGKIDKTPAEFTWTYDYVAESPVPTPVEEQDVTAPSLSISSPSPGQSLPAGTSTLTIKGTASDNVAVKLVEGSVNGGPMIPYAGTTSWSYDFTGFVDGQSYTIDVRARDEAGNTKTAQTSFSVQLPQPTTPPAPSGEDQKILKATLNTWSNENMQYSLFNPYLDSSTDRVRLHVSLNHDITLEEYKLTESLPSKIKGMEFFSLAEIRAHAPILAQRGYDFCDYDIEPGDGHTPQAEFDDFVNSIRTASMMCRNAGLDMHCSPANWKLRQADNIEKVAPLCDELHFQFQVVQDEPDKYLAYAKEYSARARAANPDIKLTIQLSTQQPAAPGKTLLETFKSDWTSVKPYVDGVSIWWGNDTPQITTMTDFMAWFDQYGRK